MDFSTFRENIFSVTERGLVYFQIAAVHIQDKADKQQILFIMRNDEKSRQCFENEERSGKIIVKKRQRGRDQC